MKRSAVLERTPTRPNITVSEATRTYWLLCTSCLWSETVYASEDGPEWPPRTLLQDNLIYHRGCGGLVKIFGCEARRGNPNPVLLSARGCYQAPR